MRNKRWTAATPPTPAETQQPSCTPPTPVETCLPQTPPTPNESEQLTASFFHSTAQSSTPPSRISATEAQAQAPPSAPSGIKITGKAHSIQKPPSHHPKKSQQMYLDFGQKDIAQRVTCAVCGMLYVHGLNEDAVAHQQQCDAFQHGVRWTLSHATTQGVTVAALGGGGEKISTTIGESAMRDGLIVQIRPANASSALLRKVQQVREIVDQELSFEENSHSTETPITTYLCIVHKRVVGLLGVQAIVAAYDYDGATGERAKSAVRAKLGVHQVWVHPSLRQRDIATQLLDAARLHFVYGTTVARAHVAFSSPTAAGLAFARGYQRKAWDNGNAVHFSKDEAIKVYE